jgi:hypothetical protein
MAIHTARTLEIGRGETPTDEHMDGVTISGLALEKGDSSTTAGTTLTDPDAQGVGWIISTQIRRAEALIYFALPARLKRGARVIAAWLHLKVTGSAWTSTNTVPTDGTAVVDGYAIRRPLSPTLAGVSWANWATGQPWDQPGVKFGPGSDVDAAPIVSFTWAQADHDAGPSLVAPATKTLDIRGELQRLLYFDEPLQLILRGRWSKTGIPGSGSGSDQKFLEISNPAGNPDNHHTWLEALIRNPIEIYGATPDHKPDQTNLKDLTITSLEQHLYFGTPPKGGASGPVEFHARNEIEASQPAVLILPAKTHVMSVDQSGVAGTGRLRYPRGFQTATGQQTPSGRWRFTFTSATEGDLEFRGEADADFSDTLVSPNTLIDITIDQTIQYDSLDALTILADAWSGTFVAGDVLEWETLGDQHTTATPLSTLAAVRLAPHVAGDRTVADTSEARVAEAGAACQLYRHDTSEIQNSGGQTGVIANVTDGAHSGTHIKVPDTLIFQAGAKGTLATFAAHSETDGTSPATMRVEHVTIKNSYAMDDPTYGGHIGFEETLANPNQFDGLSIFTTGLWLGKLEVPNQMFLAQTASTASANIVVTSPPPRTSGTLTLLDLTTGTSERRTVNTSGSGVVGTTIPLTAAPSFSFPAGSLVFWEDEELSSSPFFAWAEPPTSGIDRGHALGFLTAFSYMVA